MAAKALIQRFAKLFAERTGERYTPAWGRDTKILKALLETYDFDKLETVIDLYFSTQRRIYSIPFFKVAVSELIQIRPKENLRRMEDNESWRFI